MLAALLAFGTFAMTASAGGPGGGGGGGIGFKIARWLETPSAKLDLVYNGDPQELVTAGVAENGTPKYDLGADYGDLSVREWSSDVPTATDPGTYTVWYGIEPDSGAMSSGVTAVSLVITIEAASTIDVILDFGTGHAAQAAARGICRPYHQ